MLCKDEQLWKFPCMEVIRGKWNKVKHNSLQVDKVTVINEKNTGS